MLAHLPNGIAVVVVALPWGQSWIVSDRLSAREIVVAKAMALARMWSSKARAAAIRESEVSRAMEEVA